MKKLFLLFSLFSAQVLDAQNINDKLVAFFPFGFDNGTKCEATDQTQNGSNGVLTNPGQGCDCGAKDLAPKFDGVSDGLLFIGTVNETFTAGDFSVSFYMKPLANAQSGTQVIMAKQAACDQNAAFWIKYNPQTRTIASSISETASSIVTVQGKLDPDPCWHHIVVTRSFKVYRLYINGRLRDEKTSPDRIDLTSQALLQIAPKICPTDKPYKGLLDELRVYKKALGNDDIAALNLHPDQILNRDTLIYLGNSFQTAIGNTCANNFEWKPTDGIANTNAAVTTITPLRTTTYYLSFKHSDAVCRDSLVVTVIDPDTLDCNKIFIPNAFVPTGVNRTFFISNPFAIGDFGSMEIFDRWGGRIYSFADQFDAWDGTFGGAVGTPCNPGLYLYRLLYTCHGEEKVRTGTLTLIR